MSAMRRLMVGRTTIMIAHRLSTLDNCDARLHLEGAKLFARRPAPVPPSPPATRTSPAAHPRPANLERRP
jgi:hypothetical protein